MSDPTAARNRAIEVRPNEEDVRRALAAADSGNWWINRDQAARVLAAEVRGLRALAAAPTADAAETDCAHCEASLQLCESLITRGSAPCCSRCTEDETHRFATSEGVDAAAEPVTLRGAQIDAIAGVKLPLLIRMQVTAAVRTVVDRWIAAGAPTDADGLRPLVDAPDLVAPESVDAADGQDMRSPREVVEDFDRKQAELTAAQAAIQRVRELHTKTVGGFCITCMADIDVYERYPCPTVRALDGDTTEEGR